MSARTPIGPHRFIAFTPPPYFTVKNVSASFNTTLRPGFGIAPPVAGLNTKPPPTIWALSACLTYAVSPPTPTEMNGLTRWPNKLLEPKFQAPLTSYTRLHTPGVGTPKPRPNPA